MDTEGDKITIAVEADTIKTAVEAVVSRAATPISAGETDEIQTDDLPLLRTSENQQQVRLRMNSVTRIGALNWCFFICRGGRSPPTVEAVAPHGQGSSERLGLNLAATVDFRWRKTARRKPQ